MESFLIKNQDEVEWNEVLQVDLINEDEVLSEINKIKYRKTMGPDTF